jgi:hypothetical protein
MDTADRRVDLIASRVLGEGSMLERHDGILRRYQKKLDGDWDDKGNWQDGVFQNLQRGQQLTRVMIAGAVALIPLLSVLLNWVLLHSVAATGIGR